MTHIVDCAKLHKQTEGLANQPYPGELGKRIYDNISAEAWQLWLDHQTMLINEYRLSMLDAKARVYLREEMEKFLFGTGSDAPAGFVPPKA